MDLQQPSLRALGFTSEHAAAFAAVSTPDLRPARVVEEHRNRHRVATGEDRLDAVPAGRLRRDAAAGEEFPAVGDFVAVAVEGGLARIEHVLPRRSCLRRVAPAARGAPGPQVLAANVDCVFVVTSMNFDFRPRRIERFLAAVATSGAEPVLVLSKADLVADQAPFEAEARRIARSSPVVVLSALTGDGVESLRPWLAPGRTAALAGASGVGKSTLVNRLLGLPEQATREIRGDDDRGRHATTARRLLLLPGGGMLVDMPGLREIAVWDEDDDAAGAVFDEVADAAAGCRFRDCRHESEPGCAVQAAIAEGRIDPDRAESARKLAREQAWLARKLDRLKADEEKRRWKRIHTAIRRRDRDRGRP